jgi:membrane protease YdiL (CAAX protease family)
VKAVDIRDETVVTLLRLSSVRAAASDWCTLVVLAVVGWVGAVAYLGRYRPNQVAQVLYAVASRETLFYGAIAVTLAAVVGLRLIHRRQLAGAALVIASFLVGHLAYAWLYQFMPARFAIPFDENSDAIGFALSRLCYGTGLAVPMVVAWWLAFGRGRGWPRLTLGLGDFTVRSRDIQASAPAEPAWRALLTGYALFCLILLVVMQANVGFGPVRSGTLWLLMPAVLVAAFVNGFVEEFVFRGLVQPAFIRGGGLAAGLWVQGLLFGLMHWGMSVGVLAALPVSLLIGLGSVVWGKLTVDTGGLGWAVIAHAMVDICVMSAFFVPRG